MTMKKFGDEPPPKKGMVTCMFEDDLNRGRDLPPVQQLGSRSWTAVVLRADEDVSLRSLELLSDEGLHSNSWWIKFTDDTDCGDRDRGKGSLISRTWVADRQWGVQASRMIFPSA